VTATTTSIPVHVTGDPDEPREIRSRRDRGDQIFYAGTLASGWLVLAIMVGVGLFLGIKALDALRDAGFGFVTTAEWDTFSGNFGIAAVMVGTAMIGFVAVFIAIPISLGTSLFIAEVAPPRIRSKLVAVVDLMAAVPSVVYGVWGVYFLQGGVVDLSRWISRWFGFIPFFAVDGYDHGDPLAAASVFTSSTFLAGIVVAMMVIPIQASIMREVFSQVPSGEREGAYALGATRWGTIRIVSLPFGRGGIIGGTMLGLGRALGETIAVILIISPRFDINFHVLEVGGNSVSALIGNRFGEASGFELSALMAAGLALFVVTLIVNFAASAVVARSRSGAESEA
jgi:phosphate transport system permease protein